MADRDVVTELRAQALAWAAQADELRLPLRCTQPAYGAPGVAHCAACCYGTMLVITNAADQAVATVADALDAGARALLAEADDQVRLQLQRRP